MSTAIGKFVKAERKRLKMTQVELAEKLGMSRTWIAMIESGQMPNPRLSTIQTLSKGLHISPENIVRACLTDHVSCPVCGYSHQSDRCPACGY